MLASIAVVALLWVAAVAFGAESRDGRDWLSRGSPRDRTPRIGD